MLSAPDEELLEWFSGTTELLEFMSDMQNSDDHFNAGVSVQPACIVLTLVLQKVLPRLAKRRRLAKVIDAALLVLNACFRHRVSRHELERAACIVLTLLLQQILPRLAKRRRLAKVTDAALLSA